MTTHERAIGIFDSGVGGLTVMRAVADLIPGEDLLYLGDTARVPYGNRSAETVCRYAVNASTLLVNQDIKALVVACNTASAYALDVLTARFDVPVVGVIAPVAARAAAVTESGEIGVIGTRGTIRSGSYSAALAALGDFIVHERPCPLFVPLAEEGWTEGAVPRAVARRYFEELTDTDIDTVILGCTHYPILADTLGDVFTEVMGRRIRLCDSASATATALRETLADQGLLTGRTSSGQRRFWATDGPAQFEASAGRFFGTELRGVEHVDIVDTGHEIEMESRNDLHVGGTR